MSNTDELYGQLKESFPDKAYSADSSRGFQLTSLKAAYVTERLNDVFGLCGIGWRYVYSPIRSETIGGRDEQIVHVALQFRVEDDGIGPVYWSHNENQWGFIGDVDCWSEPIFAVGGNSVGKGSIPVTDAMKSAVTNGIGKAASMIGVGHEMFRGEIRVGSEEQQWTGAKGARERAKTPAAPSDNGKKPSRTKPLTPDQVESAMRTKVAGGGALNDPPASQKQAETVASLFQKAFPDEEDPAAVYHACLVWLWKVDSAKGLTISQASATIDWLKADDSWELHPCVIEEANAILEKVIGEGKLRDVRE